MSNSSWNNFRHRRRWHPLCASKKLLRVVLLVGIVRVAVVFVVTVAAVVAGNVKTAATLMARTVAEV